MNLKYRILLLSFPLFLSLASSRPTIAQNLPPNPIKNPSLEDSTDGKKPTDWNFINKGGGSLTLYEVNPVDGKLSAKLDSTDAPEGEDLFTNLMQVIDATPYRGKKLRYRATVRTADLAGDAKVQLWFRVDRKPDANGQMQLGAFDNMQDRPINTATWKEFDIVLSIADDAEKLVVGIFLIGRGTAWFDNASLQPADSSAKTTDMKISQGGGRTISPALQKAFAEAENAPPQPFFTNWLWLAFLAIILSALAMCGPLPAPFKNSKEEAVIQLPRNIDLLRKFSLRFSVLYWGVYCLDDIFSRVPWIGPKIATAYAELDSRVVHWMANRWFGIEGELVPTIGNGSGDTTHAYLSILAFFCFAFAGAVLWSLVDWRKTDYAIPRDLLRSYLRFALALSMLGYGLAKVSIEFNQFPVVGPYQLDKTWGASSPMNVLWAFMGSSRPYTIFAGLGEVAAALLLIWRRTTVLGAMIAFGVMVNVMMLNYCYDVPVKIYSTHLVMMSSMIILPEAPRLLSVFLLNRTAQSIFLAGVWGNGALSWVRAGLKLVVLGYFIAFPLGVHTWRISQQLAKSNESSSNDKPERLKKYRLISRGFHWINEVPFNR
jgi:hypothetical protein